MSSFLFLKSYKKINITVLPSTSVLLKFSRSSLRRSGKPGSPHYLSLPFSLLSTFSYWSDTTAWMQFAIGNFIHHDGCCERCNLRVWGSLCASPPSPAPSRRSCVQPAILPSLRAAKGERGGGAEQNMAGV